uniref:Uncharacterized protein n=1 Tax=Macrostomum lignano TaxID=282301 RepID=A0A1I8G3Z2_9PLAT
MRTPASRTCTTQPLPATGHRWPSGSTTSARAASAIPPASSSGTSPSGPAPTTGSPTGAA